MELRDGFKHTEIGIYPEGWSVLPLRSVLKENPKYGINAAAVKLKGNLPTYIRITDISDEGYFLSTEKVGVDSPFSANYQLADGDLVFARTGASVGKSYLYDIKDGELIYAGFLIKISPDQRLLLSDYLFQFVKTKTYWNWVKVMSMRSGQPGINGNEYGQLPIPIPATKAEQTAIANALSDTDAWIQSLTRLIAKKRQIKQGAMQTLLTGRERLPEFMNSKKYKQTKLGLIPDDWEIAVIGEKIDLLTGYPFPSNGYASSGIRLLRGSNIKRGTTDWDEEITEYWDKFSADIKKYVLNVGDIVVAMDGSLVGRSFARITANDLPALLLQRVARIRTDKIAMGYLKEWVCSKFFTEHCDSVKTVTAIPHISPKDIREFVIPLPPTKTEQAAIADILSNMDNEIVTLETKLTKAQQIKQGMMQNLLTGRIRLI